MYNTNPNKKISLVLVCSVVHGHEQPAGLLEFTKELHFYNMLNYVLSSFFIIKQCSY